MIGALASGEGRQDQGKKKLVYIFLFYLKRKNELGFFFLDPQQYACICDYNSLDENARRACF